MARLMLDVGVGQQDEVGTAGLRHALGHGPQLAAPSGRARGAGQHGQTWPRGHGRQRPCDRAGAVGAAVVHQDDADRAGIVLCQEGAERGRDDGCLVAGRNHDSDRRSTDGGDRWRNRRARRGQLRAGPPELAVAEQEVEPDQAGECGEEEHVQLSPPPNPLQQQGRGASRDTALIGPFRSRGTRRPHPRRPAGRGGGRSPARRSPCPRRRTSSSVPFSARPGSSAGRCR